MPMGKVAIIGGGISGIMLSYRLKQKGFGSTIFEKSRGVGGRMATKRWKEKSYDHAAFELPTLLSTDHGSSTVFK